MKKILIFLALFTLGLAQSANNLVVTQWKPDGSGPIQRNVPATAAITNGNLQSYLTAIGAASRANNLSDLASAATARTNLGVTATGGDSTYNFRANNLSDVASASGARSNLGLGSMATQNASAVAITGGTVTGLGSPSASSDAATKGYVDSISVGIVPRTGVVAATTANITLSGAQTIDGVSVVATNRVLVKNQTTTKDNGIYVAAAGAWSRATDSDTAGELLFGYYYFVSGGTTQGATSWFIQTPPTTLGTDPVLFSQFSASLAYSAGTGLTLAGNVFSITSPIPLSLGGTGGTDANTARIALGAAASSVILDKNNNLSDVASVVTSRINLGVTATGVDTTYNYRANNLSDVSSVSTARSNLGLGSMALQAANSIAVTGGYATGLTNFSADNNTNLRVMKVNLHLSYNVKDYGAVGDGSTNDTSAIASCVTAAIAAHGMVYFPAGTYPTDQITVTGAAGLVIYGDGKGVSVLKHRTANSSGAVLNVSSSSNVSTYGLTFNGNCSTRTAGGQAVVYDAVQSSFTDNEIINSGEYAFFSGSGATQIYDLLVSRNLVHSTYADGINFQNVTNSSIIGNIVDGADDDCIAVGYNGSGSATHIVVSSNFCRSRNDLGTTWGRGIFIGEAHDVLVVGNIVTGIKQSGILVSSEGVSRPGRILVDANYIYNVAIRSGHGIEINGVDEGTISNNRVQNIAQGNCIEIADWGELTIQGNDLSQQLNVFCRGIHANEASGTFMFTTWRGLIVRENTIKMQGASTNSSIYLSPHSSITMAAGAVVGNVSSQIVAGDYIYVASARQSGTWKIGNNVTITGNSVTSGGTLFNNN